MKEVSVFGSVTLLKNGVSVSVSLIPTKLLQQTFNGEKVTPDWGEVANQPVIYPVRDGFQHECPGDGSLQPGLDIRWHDFSL